MKKYLSIIISAALILTGLIGALVCIIPSASAEYKIVDKFISAVDKCDADGITACYPVDEISSALGGDYDDLLGTASEGLESKRDYLDAFCSSAGNMVPEDAKSVESIELVSCTKAEAQGNEYLSGATVEGVIKVEYKTADDKTASFTVCEEFSLLKVNNKYKIIS